MQTKILKIVITIFLFLLFNDECRTCSSYFPSSKWKKYIFIENNKIADLLIAKSAARDLFVKPMDYNKMSIVGLMSYIFIGPINLFALIIGIMSSFANESNSDYLWDLWIISFGIVSMICAVFAIIFLINTNNARPHK